MELDYSTDILNDEIFRDIKDMPLSYLFEEINVLDIEDEFLISAIEFLDGKYKEMLKLKNAMKVNYYNSPFREISESMDKITLENQLAKSKEPHIITLTKDISYILDELIIHQGIVNRIIGEKLQKISEVN